MPKSALSPKKLYVFVKLPCPWNLWKHGIFSKWVIYNINNQIPEALFKYAQLIRTILHKLETTSLILMYNINNQVPEELFKYAQLIRTILHKLETTSVILMSLHLMEFFIFISHHWYHFSNSCSSGNLGL
jgi:hypothetical protein